MGQSFRWRALLACAMVFVGGCGKGDATGASKANADGTGALQVLLDWKPEPEFGGFYAARLPGGAFASQHLNVDLKTAGEGAPTWQLLANGQADFATTAADQVLQARSQGADVVAVFAVYQTFPQGVMVHKARNLKTLADVFASPGTLAAEDNAWLRYCLAKFAPVKATVTGYTGGIEAFLARPDYSQQCYVTSEPIQAAKKGGDPQTFLIADAGYNPYSTVLVTRGEILRNRPEVVKSMVQACRDGWQAYLADPSAANAQMGTLNKEMDADTFAAAAAAQKTLIQPDAAKTPVGSMTQERWDQLRQQLIDLKVLDPKTAPAAASCFVNE